MMVCVTPSGGDKAMVTPEAVHSATEDIVRSELKDSSTGLGSVKWYRAVLDEAHVIEGHKQAGNWGGGY